MAWPERVHTMKTICHNSSAKEKAQSLAHQTNVKPVFASPLSFRIEIISVRFVLGLKPYFEIWMWKTVDSVVTELIKLHEKE